MSVRRCIIALAVLTALAGSALAAPAQKNYAKLLGKRDKFDAFGWTLSTNSSNDGNGTGPSFSPIPSTLEQNPLYNAPTEFDFASLVSTDLEFAF